MAIQMRRGLKEDFDPSKMLPGEWAVSIDSDTNNQIIWMCFRAGVVKRMGTYEDFKAQIEEATGEIKEEYLAEFQTILEQIEKLAEQTSVNTDTVVTIRDDVVNTYLPQMLEYLENAQENMQLASEKASAASESVMQAERAVIEAESFSHGGTETRENEDIDNAKYYYENSKEIYENFSSAGNVVGVKGDAETAYRTGNVNITPANIGLNGISKIISFTKSIVLTTEWQDTGLTDEDFKEYGSGVYLVQVGLGVNTQNSGETGVWTSYYFGIIGIYCGGTNSGDTSEVVLHAYGHAPNKKMLYLRTKNNWGTNGGRQTIQVAFDKDTKNESTLVFRFRRLL